jgi:hypothetical protein
MHSKRLSAADMHLLNKAKIGVVNAGITAGILRKYGFSSILLLDGKSGKKENLKSKLCGCDVIIGAGEEGDAAKAAEKLGVPFIPASAVTIILPDGIRYSEMVFPRLPKNFKNETIACAQACEAVKVISGIATPIFAPLAFVAERDGLKLRKVKLKVK